MCFSILQVSRCVTVPTSTWLKIFHNYGSASRNSCSFGVLASRASGLEEGDRKRWTRPLNTKAEGTKKVSSIREASNLISEEISDGPLTISTRVNIKKSEISKLQSIRFCDIKLKTGELGDLASLVTVIVFDIETTGFSRDSERIIEIALQDIAGGKNSIFETLVNPERNVANSNIHGISTHMVNRPGVPRMKDLIPIILQYVRSRQKPGGCVMWVAHNARSFDVPFLANEFSRCSFEIPRDWIFLDTLPLAREVMKKSGSKFGSKANLEVLREHYDVKINGSPHRASFDVRVLTEVLQRMTFDLKLPVAGLIEKTFTVSHMAIGKKKKNRD